MTTAPPTTHSTASRSSCSSSPVHRHCCYFTGHVQGVGFRYTCQNIALQYNVVGYVKNLRDGRVELVVEGPDSEMNSLVGAIQDRMREYIQNVDVQQGEATGEYKRFCIKH